MQREEGLPLILGIVIGLVFGISGTAIIASEVSYSNGRVDGRREVKQWVETCWPHKPVWTKTQNVCWIDGLRVHVGD